MVIEARPVSGLSERERQEQVRLLPITQLKEAVDLLTPPERDAFFRLFELVDDRFMNDGSPRSNGYMRIPNAMRPTVFNMFKNIVGSEDEGEVISAVTGQWTVTVTDRYAKRQAKYNPFRSARPIDRSKENVFMRRIKEEEGNDPFCDADNKTPVGPFGRYKTKFGTSCANLTNFGTYHEVLIGPHNPYEMREEHFIDQMNKALMYGLQTFEHDREAIHLTWGMNFGFRAGASQPHQHSQVVVDRGSMHHAEVEEFHEVAARYRQENPGRNYLDDWLAVHESLGLAKRIDNPDSEEGTWVVMPLTPSKERNVVVIAPKPNGYSISESCKHTCWDVVDYMMQDQGVSEFNTKFFMTPYGREYEYWQDFRPMFTLVDRGDSSTSTSDMGFMETSGIIVLLTDPKRIAQDLFRKVG